MRHETEKKHTNEKEEEETFCSTYYKEKRVVTDHKLSEGHESNRQPTDSCAAPF